MALDGLLLHVILKRLQSLCPCKVNKIQNISDEEICFHVYTRHGNEKIVVNAHSNSNRIYLDPYAVSSSLQPSNFVMVLRKCCSQAILDEIQQIGFDRILEFTLVNRDELGDTKRYKLYIELMGKYSNIVLVDHNGVIIDALKRIPIYENTKRMIHPGAQYTLPDPGQKKNPLCIDQIDRNTSLVNQIYGFSPLLSKEFLKRMQEGEKYEEILQELLNSKTLYIYKKDFHCLAMTHLEEIPKQFEFMEGFHHLYAAEEQKNRIREQCQDVYRAVEKELKKAQKKLPKLQDTLELSKDYCKYKLYGDLLFAYMGQIQKEQTVKVPSFESDDIIEIPLDMRYDIKQNANRYYQKYHKAKRSISILQEQIRQCEMDIAYFEQLHEQLRHCTIQDALEIKEELIKEKILRPKKNTLTKRGKKKPNILCLQINDDLIYVGKNNIQNQTITSKIANKKDLWFHVKDYHGSHVLLKAEKPTENLIRMCANLAAYFSKSKDSSSVPVNYCLVSELKKVPGAKTGFVTMKSYKTIFIDPQEVPIEEWIQTYKKI